MKRLLLIVLPLLLIVGCSTPEPINYEETLNERDGVFYTKDTNKPYSGQVFSLYEDGKKKGEGTLKDGKMISKTEWEYNRNGQKELERTYKDGRQDSLMTYWDNDGKVYKGKFINMDWDDIDFSSSNGTVFCYENGGLCLGNYKDGIMDGIFIIWNENGQKRMGETFKDGKKISSKYWNEDGSVRK
jgi:antitoxin component YwqK of YwqJK toxin-antitoxin module